MSGPATDYLQVSLGRLELLLPIQEIRNLESAMDIVSLQVDGKERYFLPQDGKRIPVISFTEELQLRDTPPKGKICVCLQERKQNRMFAVVCDQVQKISANTCNFHEIPDCMQLPGSPLRGIAIRDKQVLCSTTTEDLSQFLEGYFLE